MASIRNSSHSQGGWLMASKCFFLDLRHVVFPCISTCQPHNGQQWPLLPRNAFVYKCHFEQHQRSLVHLVRCTPPLAVGGCTW